MANNLHRKQLQMDDGFRPELIRNASFDGIFDIPTIEKEKEARIPDFLVPYSKLKYCNNPNIFCCFYEMDPNFAEVLTDPTNEEVIARLKSCAGVITPDCSVDLKSPFYAQMLNICRSRIIGAHLQNIGIYTIPNVRWGDRRTYTTEVFSEPVAFLGIPKNSTVAIGTYGAVKYRKTKKIFREGLIAMLDYLNPKTVFVYGPMPDDVFDGLRERTKFIPFDDWTKLRHGGLL